ncbi:hypothetical protein [Bordetella genomosp. 13]|uniref:hypothetical protein n=1 Tax=Bordetella genomosp. 13 TaxID=463040 RepID=UPI00119CE378|nr:hypothetical protein [Bordetella genomosp. 13]
MEPNEKAALLKALRALDRIEATHKRGYDGGAYPEITDFVDRAWLSLHQAQKLKTAARKISGGLDDYIVDEQDADTAEIISNFFFYAVDELSLFFSEGSVGYLEGPVEREVEQARFIATQAFFARVGGGAMTLTPEQVKEIDFGAEYEAVAQAQQDDASLVGRMSSWSAEEVQEARRRG